jgi:hypothetical protein
MVTHPRRVDTCTTRPGSETVELEIVRRVVYLQFPRSCYGFADARTLTADCMQWNAYRLGARYGVPRSLSSRH